MSETSTLAARLRARIAAEGPLTCRDWMAAALYDEQAGYYNRPDLARWGRAGDYRTGPERSPLFAAAFARYFAQLHAQLGAPARWTIIETGAGGGHFAQGVLNVLRDAHPRVYQATSYVLDEQSADARARARARLTPFSERVTFQRLSDSSPAPPNIILPTPGVVFANELLDALPSHRVRARGGRLRELCVGLDGGGQFAWVERAPTTPRLAEHFARLGVELEEGQAAEVNLAVEDWLATAANALTRGYLVLVDYGAEAAQLYDATQRPEGTLRAFRRHQLSADALAQPGEQDLTTTVNWTQMRQVAEGLGLRTVAYARQDEFLLRAGLLEELERLTAQFTSEAERVALRVSARDLVLPGGMGESFQVLVLEK